MAHFAPSEHPHSRKQELTFASHSFDVPIGNPGMWRKIRRRRAFLVLRKVSKSKADRMTKPIVKGIRTFAASASTGWHDVCVELAACVERTRLCIRLSCPDSLRVVVASLKTCRLP